MRSETGSWKNSFDSASAVQKDSFRDPDPGLDYRFGWRCLLPARPGQTVGSAGFTPEEERFILEMIQSGDTGQQSHPEGWVINADVTDLDRVMPDLMHPATRWFAVLGPGMRISGLRRAVSGHYRTHEYALLPPERSRVIVPLEPVKALRTGLRLHRPGRRPARWALVLSDMLARLGWTFPLRKKVLVVGIRHEEERESRHPFLPRAALYLGNPEPGRKTILLPLDSIPPRCIAKLGETDPAKRALEKEKKTLGLLALTCLKSQVPTVLDWKEEPGRCTLVLEYRQRETARPRIMEGAVADFLLSMTRLEAGERSLTDLLSSMTAGGLIPSSGEDRDFNRALIWLKERYPPTMRIRVHRCHGDFAPWNCAWTDRGLFVYDWEESRTAEPALGDAFYYCTAPAIHVRGSHDPDKILSRALTLSGRVFAKAGWAEGDVRLYCLLWLLPRLRFHPFYHELFSRLLVRFP